MILPLPSLPPELLLLPSPPKALFYHGDLSLLKRPKVAIVGTRHPNAYTKAMTRELARFWSERGVVVVSGGAFGVDVLAHEAAFPSTILISPSSLDLPYPPSHKPIIERIAKEGLLLSEYESSFMPKRYTFLERNRLIIALSSLIIIPQADLKSGSMQSAHTAIKLGKPLYVLPHRLKESLGTQSLLERELAKPLYNPQTLLERHFPELAKPLNKSKDELLLYAQALPSYEEAVARFGERIFEYELEGKILIKEGRIMPL
ncbi:DNA-processing protein DprA [Wolinella succinogenes]|uniref:DNA-processing protein DprA n=1 Tax=Wolinella succinogenes TaxID=844 RepID=UPI00240A78E8|nr:DNA-processing protein DprA [Wolinella succinogenes]